MRNAVLWRAVRGGHARGAASTAFYDGTRDPDIGGLRVVIENIAQARQLAPRRGTPLKTNEYLTALMALEQAGLPLSTWLGRSSDHKNAPAVQVVADRLEVDRDTAHSMLRRLLHLRKKLLDK